MKTRKAMFLVAAVTISAGAVSIRAQQTDAQPKSPLSTERAGVEGGRAFGTIASVGVDRFEIKRANGGALTVLVTDQTELRQGQNKIGLEDLKPGDTVMLRGEMNKEKLFVASVVRRMTEEEMQRFQQMGDRAFGEIVSTEGNQLKIHNQRLGDKTITVSDQTTYIKDGQPIALKDLKVGDRVFIVGKEENGQFTASRVMTGQFRGPGQGRRSRPAQP